MYHRGNEMGDDYYNHLAIQLIAGPKLVWIIQVVTYNQQVDGSEVGIGKGKLEQRQEAQERLV